MGKASRDKGAAYERELVNALRAMGLDAKRVPLSGATEYARNDVEVEGRLSLSGEAKRRKQLPKFFTEALDGADFAAFRQDRGETLIVLRLKTFANLLR